MMVPIVEHTDGGIYICRAENSEGVSEKKIELNINGTDFYCTFTCYIFDLLEKPEFLSFKFKNRNSVDNII